MFKRILRVKYFLTTVIAILSLLLLKSVKFLAAVLVLHLEIFLGLLTSGRQCILELHLLSRFALLTPSVLTASIHKLG